MTQALEHDRDREINSDFVDRNTMSFSLYAMVAEHSETQNSRPQNCLRPGADASAIHGRLGCSGCTPAEPYPPNRAHQHSEPGRRNQLKAAIPDPFLTQTKSQTSNPVLLLNQNQ